MNDETKSESFPGNANLRIGALGNSKSANQEIGVPGVWHSRGYLPHFDDQEKKQHVTFHLADSLPAEVLERLQNEVQALPPEKRDVEWRKRVEAWMDAGHGSCILREPYVAAMVQNALLFFDAQRYRLFEWVIMPNHVHVLFQPICGWTVAKIVASWKKFTATQICAFRRNAGNANLRIGALDAGKPVWHREYWDRFIRDQRHFQQAREYIHQNPVKAGLVVKPEDWPWSSASLQQAPGGEREDANQEIRKLAFPNANQEIGVPGVPGVPGEKA